VKLGLSGVSLRVFANEKFHLKARTENSLAISTDFGIGVLTKDLITTQRKAKRNNIE